MDKAQTSSRQAAEEDKPTGCPTMRCAEGREGEEGTAWGNMVPIDFSQNWKDWCNSVPLEIMHRAALVSSCAQWIKFGTETLFWGEAVQFASLWLLRFWHLGDFIFFTVEIIYQNPCNSDARYRRCLFLCSFFPALTPFYILCEVQCRRNEFWSGATPSRTTWKSAMEASSKGCFWFAAHTIIIFNYY